MILDLGDRNVWERAFYIREYFYNLQGSAIFANTYSPQARALSFIISTQSPIPADGEDPSYVRPIETALCSRCNLLFIEW